MNEHGTLYAQYYRIKLEYPDYLVLMRIGDFIEAFDHDAEVIAEALDLTLVAKVVTRGTRRTMAGFPFAMAEQYMQALILKGHLIALAEQVPPETLPSFAQAQRLVTQGKLVEGDAS